MGGRGYFKELTVERKQPQNWIQFLAGLPKWILKSN